MKKKSIKLVLLAFLVLIVAAGGAVALGIDRIARVAVEAGATFALGVKTTLASMDIGVFSGTVAMGDLNVANPEGFTAPRFLGLKKGSLAVSLGSLMGDKVEVPEISLSGVELSLERKLGKSNYGVILDGLKKFESGEKPAAESKGGKAFVIRRAVVEGINVDVNMIGLGGDLTRVPVTIERIELRDIGSDSAGGAQLAEVSSIILKAILQAVATKAGDVLPADIAGELTAGLDGLKSLGDKVQVVGDVSAKVGGELKRLGGLGEKLGIKVEEVGKESEAKLKEAGKKVEEGLKGLIPGEKKKEKKP